jgi:hypothetical protein
MRNPITRASFTLTSWAAAALGLLALTGCDQTDPLTKPYAWHPTDINARNIAAMANNPADLVRGRETKARRAVQESDAVEHVWTGHPVPLLGGSGGSSGAAPAAAPGAGGS